MTRVPELDVQEWVVSDGTTYYALSGAVNQTSDDLTDDLESVTVDALIRENGLISEMRVSYRYDIGGEEIVIEEWSRISVLDNQTVDRPDWYEEALEEVPDRDEWEQEQYPTLDGGDDT